MALVETAGGEFTEAVAADASVTGVVQNQSIGASDQGRAQVRATERLTAVDEEASGQARRRPAGVGARRPARTEPLENLQWDMAMIGATHDGAHRRATGTRVTVGIIDTGVDASHPDIAPNFSYELSQNFTHDIPAIDGPCDVADVHRPAWVDEGGHGTHVAGIVAAARNGIGITGVAPDATIVNLRAGQDSGYFFFYETVAALLYAGDMGLDVVNMSFFTDPWLYNCDSLDDYVSGAVTDGADRRTGDDPHGRARRPRRTPTSTASRWWPPPATATPTWPRRRASTPSARTTRPAPSRIASSPTTASTCRPRGRTCCRSAPSGRRRPSPTSRTTASGTSRWRPRRLVP